MSVYVDTSVLVRIVAGQADPLPGWERFEGPVASALIEVELPRAVERLSQQGKLTPEAAAAAASRGRQALRSFTLMDIGPAVRLRAGGPFAAPIRSLDAIHLASALLWQEAHPEEPLVMATHDERLAIASRAHGLDVIGWPG